MSHPRRRGFTLVEVLVAIVIIAILISMLVVGLKYLGNSSKTRATKTTLEDARALLAAYELKFKLTDFAGDVIAPGDVSDEAADRTGVVVSLTRAIFNKFQSVPENKAAMARFSADHILGALPLTGIPAWAVGANYVKFVNRVTFNGKIYICTRDHTAVATPNPGENSPDVSGSPWALADNTTPILKDAWDNPIIFVPAGGLRDVRLKDSAVINRVTSLGTLYDGRRIPPAPDVAANGNLIDPGETAAINARPFFASAGPDGIFGFRDTNGNGTYQAGIDIPGGDDNIYSFEN
jgi:prepilin-type N-terminal cleavage/methylation domain-containing protein